MTVFNEADLKYRYMFYKCFRRYSQVYVHVYNGFQYMVYHHKYLCPKVCPRYAMVKDCGYEHCQQINLVYVPELIRGKPTGLKTSVFKYT